MDLKTRAFTALALFNSRLNERAPVCTEAEQRSMNAIHARIDVLPTLVAKSQPLMSATGLLPAAALADALARRSQAAEGMHFILEASPLFWYVSYCLALTEFGEALQEAVKGKTLTLRNSPTRLALRDEDMRWWLDMDLRTRYNGIVLIPCCAEWDQLCGDWPDGALLPPGAVLEQDAESWAVSAGLTQPGELHTLLRPHDAGWSSTLAPAAQPDAEQRQSAPAAVSVGKEAATTATPTSDAFGQLSRAQQQRVNTLPESDLSDLRTLQKELLRPLGKTGRAKNWTPWQIVTAEHLQAKIGMDALALILGRKESTFNDTLSPPKVAKAKAALDRHNGGPSLVTSAVKRA